MREFDLKITRYNLQTQKPNIDVTLAVVADLHTKKVAPVIDALEKIKPDLILSPGDMFECFEERNNAINENGFDFFEQAVKIAPVYYCFGNHETEGETSDEYPDVSGYKSIPPYVLERLASLGVHTVFDTHEPVDGKISIGGLLSGSNKESGEPSIEFVDKFSSLAEYKILLCHHPEYYEKYLAGKDVDLIISGHAHGGQWRIFGRGVFAPGQGLFPKYTSGLHDGRFIISRGCSNSTRPIPVPRFFNPKEVLEIHIKSE